MEHCFLMKPGDSLLKFTIVLLFSCWGITAKAQTTSLIPNPNWVNDADWSGTAPQYDINQSATLAHNSTITNEILVKSSHILIIEAGVTLSTDQNFTVKENSTLIIRGTLRGTSALKEFKIENNATLIVESGGSIEWDGFWTTNDNASTITINGFVSVGGNFSNKGTITGVTCSLVWEGTLNNDGGSIFGCTASGSGCCPTSPCTYDCRAGYDFIGADADCSIVPPGANTPFDLVNAPITSAQNTADTQSKISVGDVDGDGIPDDVVFKGIGEKGVYAIGNQLPVGTYFYVIDKRDGSKPKTGYLELVK